MQNPKWNKGCPPNDGACGMYVVCYDDWFTGDSMTALVEWTSRNHDTILAPYYPIPQDDDPFPNGIDLYSVTEYYGPIPYFDL